MRMVLASSSKETLFSVIAVLFLGACVPEEPWTRERQTQVTELSISVRPEAARQAAERAVRELDPRSTSFDYTPDGFRAARQYMSYMVIAAMQGAYIYEVQVKASGSGSTVSTKIYVDGSAITAAGVTPTGTSLWQSADAYQLLHDRIRYHAGIIPDWVSCQEAATRYNTRGAIEPMCLGATAREPRN